MSQENVEIIRLGWEHWVATGEIRAHADFVWDVSHLRWPNQQIYIGGEGAMQFLAEGADAWDEGSWRLRSTSTRGNASSSSSISGGGHHRLRARRYVLGPLRPASGR